MSDTRLARRLLLIYPRTWRDRYGDELLVLVADTGLTWRGALDIAGAAIVERGRHLLSLSRGTADPAATTNQIGPQNFREMAVEGLARCGILFAFVVALGAAGVAYPPRWWLVYPAFMTWDDVRLPRPRSLSDRLLLWTGAWLIAIAIGTAIWILGRLAVGIGVPEPSLGVAVGYFLVLIACAVARVLHRYFPPVYRAFRAPGYVDTYRVSRLEWRCWTAAQVVAGVMFAMTDPAAEMLWGAIYPACVWRKLIRQTAAFRPRAAGPVSGGES